MIIVTFSSTGIMRKALALHLIGIQKPSKRFAIFHYQPKHKMPKGTTVERMYSALRRQGKSKAAAAKIAQAQTGLALATGRPPKGKA